MNTIPQSLPPANGGASRPVKKSPAPWVESGFVAVPREFFAVMHELSKTALTVYLGHLANALSQGERAGRSCQYRDSYAAKWHCSKSKLDRGNGELEARGMIWQNPARRPNGAQEWRLLPPSAWTFESLKNAPRLARKCAFEGAVSRPITKETEKKSFKTNSVTAEIVVVENSFPSVPPAPSSQSEELSPLALELFRAGVEPRAAAAKLASLDADRARVVLDYVARHTHLGGAWIRKAITAPGSVQMKAIDATGAPSWQKPQSDIANAAAREPYADKPAPEIPVEVEFDEADFESEMFEGVAPEAGSLALISAALRDGATFEELMEMRGFYEAAEWRALIERAREV